MGSALKIRDDLTPLELRRWARVESYGRAAARAYGIANALEEMPRADAARLAGMDRQTLRDAVVRYNAKGLEGLHDRPKGYSPRRCGAFPPSPARPCRRDKILPWSGPLSRIAVFGRSSRHKKRTKSMTYIFHTRPTPDPAVRNPGVAKPSGYNLTLGSPTTALRDHRLGARCAVMRGHHKRRATRPVISRSRPAGHISRSPGVSNALADAPTSPASALLPGNRETGS